MLPTLLVAGGFSIGEFGGEGTYVLPNCRNRFYTTAGTDNKGRLTTGTIRYRPEIAIEEITVPFIFHPVKINMTE